MRIGLRTKFLISFILISAALVLSMFIISHFVAFRNFSRFRDEIERDQIGRLICRLQEEYQNHHGWEDIRKNPAKLRMIIPPPVLTNNPFMPAPVVVPPPEFSKELFPSNQGTVLDSNGPKGAWSNLARRRIPFSPPFDLWKRITLYDDQKQYIAGILTPEWSAEPKVIVVGGNTVGWLDIQEHESPHLFTFLLFIRSQASSLYGISMVAFLAATTAAFFLARHLLAPIRQLTRGTHSFAARDFSSRIDVRSSDELGELASDFNTMAEALEKYETLQKQWLLDIAHELRTPLSILRGEIEALQDGVYQMNGERLDSLHAEVLHMSRIVNDLHELSLTESGSLCLKREPLPILKIVKEQLLLFSTSFEQRAITVTNRIDDTEAITVMGDHDRLAQLFANLLENTLRYTYSPGSLVLSRAVSNAHLSLYFDDSAPAVPDESLGRLFDRLYRADPARTRIREGSGLGLSICKHLVEAHGGSIRAAHSSLGGLRIEVTLPLT
ncbi:MAG TPA: ATP-binding protein [Thermodesulfobacteriota bacterium]|nr:HAMP domain-containing protein [Deltaproteobacteria bacterium]HNU71190.1 ATP-binding protein [Thermodesulfobacteriota bacterium]